MKIAQVLALAVFAMTLASCADVDPVSELPETEGKISFERNTRFDGRVLSIEFSREDGSKERFNTARDRWFSWTYVPEVANRAGRRWTLIKTTREATSLVYALIDWDNDDPTDYLAAGYWLHFPGQHPPRLPLSSATATSFIDGPELDPRNPPQMPLAGAATYIGSAGGLYQYRYGSNWTGFEEPVAAEEFVATITLKADFSANTLSGCIGCVGDIEITRAHLYSVLGRRAQEPLAKPNEYELHFGKTMIGSRGTFENTDVTLRHPERTVTQSSGNWGGSFSNKPDADGNPRLVAGFGSAQFDEADGSQGEFRAIFRALGPSLLPPVAAQTSEAD